MKNIMLIFILLYIALAVKSQNSGVTPPSSYFYYSYDSNGNRIKRELIIIYPSPPAPNTHNNDSLVSSSNANSSALRALDYPDGIAQKDTNLKSESFLGIRKITISPNPTTGILRIDITNPDSYSNSTISIIDFQGKLIKEINLHGSSTNIDISYLARDSYILKLVLDGMSKEWVIVKE